MSSEPYNTDHMSDEQYDDHIEGIWAILEPLFMKGAELAIIGGPMGVVDPEFTRTGEVVAEALAKLNTEDLGALLIVVGGKYAGLVQRIKAAQQ